MLGLAGGVVDSIMSFQYNPLDKMVEGINKFSEIDGTAVANLTAPGGFSRIKGFCRRILMQKMLKILLMLLKILQMQ